MRLDKLWIKSFKNLQDFSIDFEESKLVTVVVGWNGAGKSNLIEALVLIFRDLDLDEKSSFGYRLEYNIRGAIVIAEAEQGAKPKLSVGKKTIPQKRHYEYLPKQVFSYYSGPSDRLQNHYSKHQVNFRDALIASTKSIPDRRLFYAQNIHSLFVLLAFYYKPDQDITRFLNEELGVMGLESILFVIREPYWKSPKAAGGNQRFWNARGIVGQFLENLYRYALAPMRLKNRIEVNIKQYKTKEFVYLFVKSVKDFQALADQFDSAGDLFKAFESIHFSDLLDNLHIRVKIKDVDGSLTFKELSEGEQQLLMVLGLLRFTREDESLFLLDEPDTHLNPSWGIKYLDYIRDVVGEQDSSHIILASHDPLVLAGLDSKQVQILKRDGGNKVIAFCPEYGPKGLGVSGILTSDIFGLASELDQETLLLLAEKKELEVKKRRTNADKKKLEKISNTLDHLGFKNIFKDPDYTRFLGAWHQAGEEMETEVTITPEERQRKNELALEIVKKMVQKNSKAK